MVAAEGHVPSSRTPERSFGLGVGGVCLVAAACLIWRGRQDAGLVLGVTGLLLVALGRIWPAALGVPSRVWWRFAHLLGWVNARVLLTLFFALVLTPAGVLMRLVGRNPLRAAGADTNWNACSARRRDPKHYEHLF
jgi:hypothetical protein